MFYDNKKQKQKQKQTKENKRKQKHWNENKTKQNKNIETKNYYLSIYKKNYIFKTINNYYYYYYVDVYLVFDAYQKIDCYPSFLRLID